MGSQLRDRESGEIVWLDFAKIPWNPLEWGAWLDGLFEKMQFGSDRLAPDGIVQDVLFLPPLVKQEQYSRLLNTLASWGYVVNPTEDVPEQLVVHTFAYDWRQNNRISGKQLGEQVERWRALHPGRQVWLMGHSNGGIISRWYIEKEGGKEHVGRLILLASPWDGAVKGLYALLNGFDMFLRWGFDPAHIGARTREVLRKFPGIYQLLPQARSFVRGPHDEILDHFQGQAWLDDPQVYPLLADGKQFNQELGNAHACSLMRERIGRTLIGWTRKWATAPCPNTARCIRRRRKTFPSSPNMAASTPIPRCKKFCVGNWWTSTPDARKRARRSRPIVSPSFSIPAKTRIAPAKRFHLSQV
jgi:pimeloyl-ACP methyl ester carboxylesterase